MISFRCLFLILILKCMEYIFQNTFIFDFKVLKVLIKETYLLIVRASASIISSLFSDLDHIPSNLGS